MYSTKVPYGAVKEHERDYLVFKGDKFYIRTYYAGIVEIEKQEFERLERQGLEVR